MSFIPYLLLALSALPAFAQTVTLVSGNGQMAQENFPAVKPMVIKAVNAAGAGIPNATVTWTVTQGDGALSDIVTTTDANGQASALFRGVFLPPPESYRRSIVNATVTSGGATIGAVDFVVITYASRTISGSFAPAPLVELIAPTGDLSGSAGSLLPRAVGIRVVAQAGLDIGKGIPFIALRINEPEDPNGPTASCSGPNNSVLTDQNGEAYCDVILGPTAASGYLRANAGEAQLTRLFQVTITPGAACTFNVSPATSNIGSAGTTGTVSITVATGQNCGWAASTTASWITITSGGSGQGNGTLGYTVAANTGPARTGVINVAGRTVTINQAAAGSSGGQITLLSSSPLPSAVMGAAYSFQLAAAGGTPPYRWSNTGSLPPGLTLNTNTGAISGAPNTSGTFSFSIIVTDAANASTSQPYTMSVAPAQVGGAPLTIVSTSPLSNATVGANYSSQFTASGGTTPYQWTASGNIPTGLSLNPSTGTLSGTPANAGTYTFSVSLTDAVSTTITKQFTLTVNPAGAGGALTINTTSPLPTGTVNVGYNFQFNASGGTQPYQWSAGGTFPPGLGLVATTGAVTGTPSTVGTFSFTINVSDLAGATTSKPFTMTVSPAGGTGALTISPATLPNGAVGAAYQQALSASGACNSNPFGGGSVNWTLATGALPRGLNFVTVGTGATISGTPEVDGSFTFSVRATDTCGRSETKSYTLVIGSTSAQIPMTATPANIEFSVGYTAASSPEQTVAISTGATNMTFNATTTTPWLKVTPGQASSPSNIVVQAVNIGAFAPGVYDGSVVITSAASNSPLTIPVTLRVAAPSNIGVGPESLLFRHTLAAPISQQVLNVGGASTGIRFTVTFSTDAGGTWLRVNPVSGQTPQALSVTVDSTGLAPGTYTGAVRVTPDANAGGFRSVPVTLIVQPATALTSTQSQLTFNAPGSQTLSIGATGGPIPFSVATTGGTWLTATPPAGTAPADLTISVSTAGLAPGTYQGLVVVTATGTSQSISIPVTFNLTQGQPIINAVTNGASFATGAVAPGEIITLFGTNIGPATLTSAAFDSSGALQSTVSDIQVLFDNIPAPLIYVAQGQVAAVVPFGLFGRTTTRVQLVNGAQRSNTVDVPVADAAPGIFVLDTSGQGAIINQDGTINARLNGAEPGSIISIYATGAGQMDRQVFDGRRIMDEPYPRPLLPVGVRIGGRVADIRYAGAAPGQVAGLVQVNAVVPADTPRGTTVPVQLTIGSVTSQANVFLATRP